MDIRLSEGCEGCVNGAAIEKLATLEATAQENGSLVSKGSVVCRGLRIYGKRERGVLPDGTYERCLLSLELPTVSDAALEREIAASQPNIGLRPVHE